MLVFAVVTGAEGAFSAGGIITGLTAGTAYWFDLGLASGSSTVNVLNLSCSAMEF